MADKRNTLRFFYPTEWYQFIAAATNRELIFWLKLLLHTGLRIAEARALKITNINLERKYLTVLKGKGNKQRQVFFSTPFKIELKDYIKTKKLQPEDTFGIPTTQYMDRVIKKVATKSGLTNPNEFSCHTFRKTHENYLCVKGVNTMAVTMQMGHTVNVATAYYVQNFLKQEEKQLIKSILGDLFDGL